MVSTKQYITNQRQAKSYKCQRVLEYTIEKSRSSISGNCDHLLKAKNENQSRKGETRLPLNATSLSTGGTAGAPVMPQTGERIGKMDAPV